MSELRYETSGDYRSDDQLRFARFARSLFYEAELAPVHPNGALDLQVMTGLVHPYPVNASAAITPFRYSRSLRHIRVDRADICVLFLVMSGSIKAAYQGHRAILRPGDVYLVRSTEPHELEILPEPGGPLSHVCIALPPELVVGQMGWRGAFGRQVTPPSSSAPIVEQLFVQLLESGEAMPMEVADALVRALLTVLSPSMRAHIAPDAAGVHGEACGPASIKERRLQEIERYLELHVTNPDLNAMMVADACGMSTRYMAMLLSDRGTSFQKLVREMRIAKMCKWLESAAFARERIATLSYRAGFKSHSHFTSVFRQTQGQRPRDYRLRSLNKLRHK